ncbi:5,6-dimethylbenzimidazole synthase [Nitrospina watsonii]|uniref:Adenosylcobinamide kinase n=1 Tax=Nitrospina watsonii TaxID=1323948 RepID=A0ABM9HH50_9BACT|nr:5,6-dimethylbenzimidazole synthase [Nitrospina watsonii]CAI2719337.1 Adenosylcobinamide kinase [Nitrospina watsonii]
MNTTILITGGCRSGKSRHALQLAQHHAGEKIFLATAEAGDAEMQDRIRMHRAERGPDWITFEEPENPVNVLESCATCTHPLLVLDCITLWLSNLMMKSRTRETILECVETLLNACDRFNGTLILITNEVGAGIVPDSALGRAFRDIAGEVNQRIAARCDEVVHTVAGIPTAIKIRNESAQPAPNGHASGGEFAAADKAGLYKAIFERRDVRHFKPDPIAPDRLHRILNAAHHAGSVGFSQPWNFIVIDDAAIKDNVFDNFSDANEDAAGNYSGSKRELYSTLKLEGIRDAPVNLLVTCDRERGGPHVLGRNTVVDTDLFSTCCAVQNLWLAARAEGIGVGWVSILSMDRLKADLRLPDSVVPVAYLCLGVPAIAYDRPMLEQAGWARRLPLDRVVYHNRWGQNAGDRT